MKVNACDRSGTRRVFAVCLVLIAGCSLRERFAQTAAATPVNVGAGAGGAAALERDGSIAPPIVDAGAGRDSEVREPPPPPQEAPAPMESPACPRSLDQLLTVSTFELGIDIRYKRLGYESFPLDESVLFSVSPGGRIVLGVRENSGNRLLMIRMNSQLSREGNDVWVFAIDLGGLVAHDDGTYALLTRRDDLGEPLLDTTTTDTYGKAAVLIHMDETTELFAQPLTGTKSITRARDPQARDCAPTFLNGRLAWNGSKYAAYFAVHGCQGDAHEPFYADKLVYVDAKGNALPGGWGWNCSISQGMRLLPGPDAFTALCMSDGAPFAGLNLVTEGMPPRQLAPEKVAAGFSAGRFGSVVRMADGSYVVGWLSRGVADAMASAARPNQASKLAPDIALLHLGADQKPLGPRKWLVETADNAETNLHLAPYGPNRLLAVWDNVKHLNCGEWTCWGTYAGTSARLIDAEGNFLSYDLLIDAPPNSEQDIVVFPNGDLGWAFVPDSERNYEQPLASNRGVPSVPANHRLAIARLRYCQ